jgi:hypothetical protein
MNEQKLREQKIHANLKLDKLPPKLKGLDPKSLGLVVSDFIQHLFHKQKKNQTLNWCFTNIKRIKIFLLIFHANQADKEIYKEEIAKNLTEYSYKTIAKIIDDGIAKKYFILLPPAGVTGKDAKVKNIRPSEELISDFLNLSIEMISYIDSKKPQ